MCVCFPNRCYRRGGVGRNREVGREKLCKIITRRKWHTHTDTRRIPAGKSFRSENPPHFACIGGLVFILGENTNTNHWKGRSWGDDDYLDVFHPCRLLRLVISRSSSLTGLSLFRVFRTGRKVVGSRVPKKTDHFRKFWPGWPEVGPSQPRINKKKTITSLDTKLD